MLFLRTLLGAQAKRAEFKSKLCLLHSQGMNTGKLSSISSVENRFYKIFNLSNSKILKQLPPDTRS